MSLSSHVVALLVGFVGGLVTFYFLQGNPLTEQVAYIALGGFSFGSVFEVLGFLREIYRERREGRNEKQRKKKERILTALVSYIDNLRSVGNVALFPPGSLVEDLGWPDISHKKEAQEFVERFGFYGEWKKAVEEWNEYKKASEEQLKRYESETDIDAKFRRKIIKEMSKSGLPSGSRQGEGGVINRKYAQYEMLSSVVMMYWMGGTHSYNVEFLVKEGYADSPDGPELDGLVSIISELISSKMKAEHENALKQIKEKREAWNQERNRKWANLLEKGDEFVHKLRDVRDGMEAERVPVEADPT